MIQASRIFHRGEERLKLEFPYNATIAGQIKKIPRAAWSQTHRAWHIPFTEEAIEELLKMFPETVINCNIEITPVTESLPPVPGQVPATGVSAQGSFPDRNRIKIEVIGRKIILKLPKNDTDIKFINTLKYSRWDGRMFCWEIPAYPGNLDMLKDYFGSRIDELIIHEKFDVSANTETYTIGNNELLIIKTRTGRLKLIFGYQNALRLLIKKYPYCSWDAKNKWWTIPFSDKYLNEIQALALETGLKVAYEEEAPGSSGVKRITAYDIPNYRQCPEEMILQMKEKRYSERTIKVYSGMFTEFINYFHKYDIDTINEVQIKNFLRYLVMERKVSTSYQNQAINAVKFYYEKVLKGQRKFYFIERPNSEITLPVVFNEEEVIRLFSCVSNIKHKCMLMLAYSAGLRLGEIVRLKLSDIDRERMQIRVEEGKGRKDRYTKLSTRFLVTYDKYLEEYKPVEYVFNGAKGGIYSESSVQNMMSATIKKAGITKEASMKTLRHTFATHSLENGVDLRYIQSMMGHASSKTTEIYTHITTKGFDQIKSPLDNLDI
jgi:site-specific recombinase XerD